MLTKDDVKRVADLARIELNEQEQEKYQAQLGRVLDYFEKLNEIDTSNIETADGGTRDLENVWRLDNNQNADNNTQELINMAPEKEKGQVKVKSVFK